MEDRGKKAVTTVQGEQFGAHKWKKLLPMAFGGHCFYVRQDVTGQQWGKHFMQREIGGIAIPDTVADKSQFVTVLGIGPNVGKKPSKAHRSEFDWPDRFSIVSNVQVGSRLLITLSPGVTTRKLKRSPLNWDFEFFIEESLPDAIVED